MTEMGNNTSQREISTVSEKENLEKKEGKKPTPTTALAILYGHSTAANLAGWFDDVGG